MSQKEIGAHLDLLNETYAKGNIVCVATVTIEEGGSSNCTLIGSIDAVTMLGQLDFLRMVIFRKEMAKVTEFSRLHS